MCHRVISWHLRYRHHHQHMILQLHHLVLMLRLLSNFMRLDHSSMIPDRLPMCHRDASRIHRIGLNLHFRILSHLRGPYPIHDVHTILLGMQYGLLWYSTIPHRLQLCHKDTSRIQRMGLYLHISSRRGPYPMHDVHTILLGNPVCLLHLCHLHLCRRLVLHCSHFGAC